MMQIKPYELQHVNEADGNCTDAWTSTQKMSWHLNQLSMLFFKVEIVSENDNLFVPFFSTFLTKKYKNDQTVS